MKNLKLNWSALLFNILMMVFLIGASAPAVGQASFMIGGLYALAVAFYSFSPIQLYPNGSLHNEVITKLFSSDVQKKIFPPNEFFSGAQTDTGIVIDAEEIEIPQDEDGEAPMVEDPKSFPLEVFDEEDKKKTYTSTLIATKPQRIGDLNQAVTSYDKRSAKMEKHVSTLNNRCAEIILHGWAPDGTTNTSATRKTTGAALRVAQATGATGNRKRAVQADILWMFTTLNRMLVPKKGRRLVIPTDMYEDLLLIENFIDADKLRMKGDVPDGLIGRVLGFDVYERPSELVYTNAANPVRKARGAASAVTDNQGAVAFHPQFVRYAKGIVQAYLNLKQGGYLGDTLNFAVRTGATKSRLSEIGTVALVEDNE